MLIMSFMKNMILASCATLMLLSSQTGPVQAQTGATEQRAPIKCLEDSPERRGEEGCAILASRPLQATPTKPVYWHIDRFDSLEAAKKAAGPDGVAAEAHGSVWLMTVESKSSDHHGGRHAAWIGPFALPAANAFTMRVMSSFLKPGSSTPVHTHSGPEIFYTVSGTQCLETVKFVKRLGAGKSFVLPGGTIHRGRVAGSVSRRLMSLVLHDAAQPPSHDLANPPALVPCN
jgi:quercetin dioxygenase-like cupin family protein